MFYVVVEPTTDGWICYNVESREEVKRTISKGGWEIPQDDVKKIFGQYVNIVSPLNTKVSNNGKTVEFIPPTQKELYDDAAGFARSMRQQLLSETDYLVLPDYPITEDKKKNIQKYRQSLRDITKQEGWPMNIVWPEKPSV